LLDYYYDKDAEISDDQKYAMGMAIRNIGDNYKSVSLLKVAIEYVESNPV